MNLTDIAEVVEVPTSIGSMWGGWCRDHGEVVIPVLDGPQGVGRWLGIHLARIHHLSAARIPIDQVPRRSGEAMNTARIVSLRVLRARIDNDVIARLREAGEKR